MPAQTCPFVGERKSGAVNNGACGDGRTGKKGTVRWTAGLVALLAGLAGCRTVPPPVETGPPAVPPATRPFSVVSYFPDYAVRQLRDLDAYGPNWIDLLHLEGVECLILHGVVDPSPDGGIALPWAPAPSNGWVKFTARDFAHIRNTLQARGIRLGISVGGEGWMNGGVLARVAADPVRRTAFAAALARFCVDNSLALVDFDWEYPKTRREESDYGRLIAEVKQRVGPSGVAVSLCVGGSEMHGRPHVDDTAVGAADRIHLMAYLPPADQRNARMAYLDKHVRYWLDVRRLPRSKLFVGLGFFGRQAGAVSPQRPRTLAYRKIYDAYHPMPGHEEAAGYWFNGVDTITRQVEYAWKLGLGGVFVWECSQDVTLDKPAGASLQAAVDRAIRRLRHPSSPAPHP